MTIYLINIVLIIILGFLFTQINPSENKKKVYCAICAVQWIFISGLRDWSVGTDTMAYNEAFERSKDTPWETILSNCWDYLFNGLVTKDPGYYLLQKIFQVFSDDYQMWLVFIAAVFTSLMARWIYKYSTMPEISFVIYSALFYSFYAVTGHRQTLATALIVFLGYEYAKKRQFVKFAIITFVAVMLHKSSIVFIIYYLIANITITPTVIAIMVLIVIITASTGSQLYAPVAYFLGFDEEQVNYSGGGAETYATVLLLLCIVAFCMLPWVKKQRADSKNLYNLLFLTICSTVLIYQNQGFMRIQQYYSLIIMIIVPELIQAFDKRFRIFVYLFIIFFLTAYLIRNNPYYRFCFM